MLVHGYGEHIGRYDEVGRTLASAGFYGRGTDLRGDGQSGGKRGFCKRFREYLDDLEQLVERVWGVPELPLLMVGHSFGGLIATRLHRTRRRRLDGLELSSPYFGLKLQVPLRRSSPVHHVDDLPCAGLPSGLKGADVPRDPKSPPRPPPPPPPPPPATIAILGPAKPAAPPEGIVSIRTSIVEWRGNNRTTEVLLALGASRSLQCGQSNRR